MVVVSHNVVVSIHLVVMDVAFAYHIGTGIVAIVVVVVVVGYVL
jgi:hypothetical protein